ncbi:MAG TPA: hypothetical protein VFZ87_12085 [Gemmatimonadales bacterium]
MHILMINCGSATLKYTLYTAEDREMQLLHRGAVEVSDGYRAAVAGAITALPHPPDAVAHRVVHGGDRLPDVVEVDIRVLNQLREMSSLAPLHNGPALEGIEATLGLGVPLIAAFDTAFHRTLPERAWRYALPELPGVRRYGFHGWSHRSVMEQMRSSPGTLSQPSSRCISGVAALPPPSNTASRSTPRWGTHPWRAW